MSTQESVMTPEKALQNLAKAVPELHATWWDHVELQKSLEVLARLVSEFNKPIPSQKQDA